MDGKLNIRSLTWKCFALLIAAALTTQAYGQQDPVRRVDQGAPGPAHDGLSWGTGYTNLQDALDEAGEPGSPVSEIWVAAGTYVPSVRFDPLFERSKTFLLLNGVAIFGGFLGNAPGGGESELSQRDPETNITTLSGDLGIPGDITDNAYSVLRAQNVDNTAVLNGFTVTGGFAHENRGFNFGGAMRVVSAAPKVVRCKFTNNSAGSGGGMSIGGSTPPGTIFVVNCAFTGNSAADGGGGGIRIDGEFDAELVNCVFSGNTAEGACPGTNGGGIRAGSSGSAALRIIKCTFSANSADCFAGGMTLEGSGLGTTLINSALWGNTDSGSVDESAQISDSNGDPPGPAVLTVTFSCIQDEDPDDGDIPFGGAGNSNIDDDPQFVDADGEDDIPGTEDDDLRLLFCSPSIDVADTASVPSDSGDLDDDGDTAETTPHDLDLNVRVGPPGGDVDMGAYEFLTRPALGKVRR